MVICLDASLVVKAITPEEGSKEVLAMIQQWSEEMEAFLAPHLLEYEVFNAILKKQKSGGITQEEGLTAFTLFRDLKISYLSDPLFSERAFHLAQDLNLPTIYDCIYLAVAEAKQCPLYTMDKAFVKKVSLAFPFVKCPGERL